MRGIFPSCLGPLWSGALALGLVACGSHPAGPRKEPAKTAAEAPADGAAEDAEAPPDSPRAVARVVGEIASVHPSGGFVLIRRTGLTALPSGGVYASIGKDGRTASLQLTGERLGRHFAADIRDGEPAAGDLVIVRPLPPGSSPALTPAGPGPTKNRPHGLPLDPE